MAAKEKKAVTPDIVQAPEEVEPAPAIVNPAPVPTSFNLAQVTHSSGQLLTQLVIMTPTGHHVVFMDGATAKAVGEALVKVGDMSSTGLVLP